MDFKNLPTLFDQDLLEHPLLITVTRSINSSLQSINNPDCLAILLLKGVYKKFHRASDQWNLLSQDITYLHSKYDDLKQLKNTVYFDLWDIELTTKKRVCDLVFQYLLDVTDLMQSMITAMQNTGLLEGDFDLDSFMEEN